MGHLRSSCLPLTLFEVLVHMLLLAQSSMQHLSHINIKKYIFWPVALYHACHDVQMLLWR